MKNLTLKIKGMHCPSCKMLIADSLSETDCIEVATVSNEKGTAEITFDEKKIDEKKIKQIIQNEGYESE